MLIAFNKPYGVICQFSHHEKYPTLKQYISIPNIYPAGRLDTDSEGLLLLTDDGKQQAQITHPRHKLIKTYWAQLEGTPDTRQLQKFTQPIDLGDFITKPARIRLLTENEITQIWSRTPPIRSRQTVSDFWLQIQIHEGKNRQVRRMTAKVGFPCLRLIRVSIGEIHLFDLNLKLGEWQNCTTLP